jgi:hypothetical protein
MLPLSRNNQSALADSIVKEMSAEEKQVQVKVEPKPEVKKEAKK